MTTFAAICRYSAAKRYDDFLLISYHLLLIWYFTRLNFHESTTGKLDFVECLRLCRVLFIGALGKIKHSAKVALPSARHSIKPSSRQNWAQHSAKIPLGKRWPAREGGHLPSDFAECLTVGTRQNFFKKNLFCRVPAPGTWQIFFIF